ncbi:MAG: TetR/AcrR family transcriptional regulator [Pseudomonadota bacterium]
MARPRSFDEATVVDAAMIAFWKLGYSETPIGALEEATGLKRVSIYNAFGDKEGLFLAALDHYHEAAKEIYEGVIAKGGLKEIQDLFTAMSATADVDAPAHDGCLMVNTVLDVRRASALVKAKITNYKSMLLKSFTCALENARQNGEMTCDMSERDERAEYLLGLLWGALAMIRVENETTAAAKVAKQGNLIIEGWKTRRK